MELIIKYTGRKVGFVTVGGAIAEPQALKISEHKMRAIREAGGPRLNVIAEKVRAILQDHIWPVATSVSVEQRGVRLVACPVIA